LRYLRFNTAFSIRKGDTPETAAGVPTGGFTWDGRANSLAEQAKLPFLSANEMANPSIDALVAKLAATPYAPEFKAAFGDGIFSTPALAFERLVMTVERFQIEDPAFAPFDSKFDAFTAGKVALSPAEQRGLDLFNNADKGNCAACHSSAKPDKGSAVPGALFTDFTYDALGVPRNASIPANAVPVKGAATYFDQGLCGPARTDLTTRLDLCGKFKVPTLRNVALRQRFFHNGQIDSLEQAVRFYVTRDTDPAAWYPKNKGGQPIVYNDLPPARRGNVNRTETPYQAKRGDLASLTEAEVQDVVVFLRTLNDGYVP
jgi:cytochrome c peroxidase